jgi:hypothetical protein
LDVESEIKEHLEKAPAPEVSHLREFFLRHPWIPGYFTQGHSDLEKTFGYVLKIYEAHSDRIVLGAADYQPQYWVAREEEKIDRFADALDELNPDLHSIEALLGQALRFGDSSVLFAAFRYHFIIEGDGDALIGDVSRVTNELEYFEMLNDIAVVARSNSQDPSDTFRTSVINTISPAINRLNREAGHKPAQPRRKVGRACKGGGQVSGLWRPHAWLRRLVEGERTEIRSVGAGRGSAEAGRHGCGRRRPS